MIYSDGETFEGEYGKGVRAGVGEIVKTDGGSYVGQFVDDVFSGNGKFSWEDGAYYEGEFKAGVFEGEGTMYDAAGKVEYKGKYAAGEEAA